MSKNFNECVLGLRQTFRTEIYFWAIHSETETQLACVAVIGLFARL